VPAPEILVKDQAPHNAADPAQVAKKQREQKLSQDKDKEALDFVLGDIRGRRLLYNLMGYCHTFSPEWEASARIHFMAGQRDVGLHLYREIENHNPDAFLQMLREAKEARS
jgi:hypothetical protein